VHSVVAPYGIAQMNWARRKIYANQWAYLAGRFCRAHSITYAGETSPWDMNIPNQFISCDSLHVDTEAYAHTGAYSIVLEVAAIHY
jgi:hypothetical protein